MSKKPTPSKDNNVRDESRRTTLKTLFGGGGIVALTALPTQWVKPVVDAVLLPTHAQTSERVAPNGFTVSTEARAPGWWDRIIPTAYAGTPITSGFLCIESTGGDSYQASFDFGSGVATGSGNIGDCVGMPCRPRPFDIVVTAKNEDGSFDFELYEGGSGCDTIALEINTTDTPCNLQAEQCEEESGDEGPIADGPGTE